MNRSRKFAKIVTHRFMIIHGNMGGKNKMAKEAFFVIYVTKK